MNRAGSVHSDTANAAAIAGVSAALELIKKANATEIEISMSEARTVFDQIEKDHSLINGLSLACGTIQHLIRISDVSYLSCYP